ncbi:hypothetical protein OGATHE_003617 [Ogataea polymorpha]|uniref:Uncharacterized protein n=1 Tax=Ogataea polymorpha TaxID=460523 RepID=A0A9P8P408_9ASCO|nr:hypothetical protein OGATHE_003617 [Ogataea polymorpha]
MSPSPLAVTGGDSSEAAGSNDFGNSFLVKELALDFDLVLEPNVLAPSKESTFLGVDGEPGAETAGTEVVIGATKAPGVEADAIVVPFLISGSSWIGSTDLLVSASLAISATSAPFSSCSVTASMPAASIAAAATSAAAPVAVIVVITSDGAFDLLGLLDSVDDGELASAVGSATAATSLETFSSGLPGSATGVIDAAVSGFGSSDDF